MLKFLGWREKTYLRQNKILKENLECLYLTYKNWRESKDDRLVNEIIRWAALAGVEAGKEEARHDLEAATNYKLGAFF